MSIADSYEVMTAHRAYKKPMATAAARAELARCAGSQFDPAYVRAFLAISLPRLLWAMGPGSLLMNLPMLRAMADTANKGVLATSQSGVLAASTAAVIGGVSATGQAHVHAHDHLHLSASPRHSAPAPANPPAAAPGNTGHLIVQPVIKPGVKPVSHRPPADPAATVAPIAHPAPIQPVQTAQPPAPVVPAPSVPPVPPVPVTDAPAPTVAFTWVPYPVIASSTTSIGFTANSTAVRVRCSLDGADAGVCDGTSVQYTSLSDGAHTVTLWAEDEAGRSGPRISTSFTIDTQGSTVAWTGVPQTRIASHQATFSFVTSDATAATWCSVDGAAGAVCTSPLTLTDLAEGPHAVSVYTVDSAGNLGPAIQTAFTVDTTGPVVTVTSAPPPVLTSSTATMAYTVDDPDATAWCSLDAAPATACTNPANFTGLADGRHTMALYAVDSLGNRGATVTRDFIVDTTAPVVTSVSAPTAPVPSRTVSIPFTLNDPTARAWCSLDGAVATGCDSPVYLSNLADGPHTIAIYAVDAAGNVGVSVQRGFTVGATAPTVTLNSVPPQLTNTSSATVGFSVDVAGSTTWCSLDGAAASACASPVGFSNLADGRHTVEVYAVGPGGQQSAPAGTAFTVDTVAPRVSVTSAPSGTVQSAGASLRFVVDDVTAAAWCSIDGAAARRCTSPLDLSALADGNHTVAVYAVDAAGNTGPTRSVSFTIDNTPPTVTFTATPPASSANRTATVTFSSNDPAATTWCALDGGTPQQCSGSRSYPGLGNGSHTISVYAVDAAGNRGPTESTTFTIATAGPVLTSTPPAKSSNKNVTFTWIAQLGFTYQYSYDGVNWTPTTTFFNTSNKLKPGNYTFHLRGIDLRGVPTAETTFTFQVT